MSWPAYYKRAEFQQVLRRSAEVCIDMITLAPDMKGASSHTSYSSAVSPNQPRAKKYLMEWTTVGCGVLGPPKAVLPCPSDIIFSAVWQLDMPRCSL